MVCLAVKTNGSKATHEGSKWSRRIHSPSTSLHIHTKGHTSFQTFLLFVLNNVFTNCADADFMMQQTNQYANSYMNIHTKQNCRGYFLCTYLNIHIISFSLMKLYMTWFGLLYKIGLAPFQFSTLVLDIKEWGLLGTIFFSIFPFN